MIQLLYSSKVTLQVSVHNKELLSGYLRKRHSVTKLVVHLVFTTQYRRKLFDGYIIEQLREAFESACEKLESDLLEMDYAYSIPTYLGKAKVQRSGHAPTLRVVQAGQLSKH